MLTVSRSENVEEWVLDYGCSFHMSPNREWFQEFEAGELETVYMGNNNACKVQGIRSIVLSLDNGKSVKLTRVRYIPELKRNLISLGTLDELGCCYKAEDGCLNVYKNKNLVLKGVKRNGLYILCGN